MGDRINSNLASIIEKGALLTLALALTLFLYGAIPLLSMPTLGQALWTSAFAESFAKQSLIAIHASHFGIPEPAAISFGLAGAWIESLFIRMGMLPADAYSCMNALWLTIALFSAYKLVRHFGAGSSLAILAAAAWMSMPIGWGHTGFSMLSLGIALMPFYFLSTVKLHSNNGGDRASLIKLSLFCMLCNVVAAFMDGYTFVMFVVGTSLLFGMSFLFLPSHRRHLMLVCAPVHLVAIGAAYAFYRTYIGGTYSGNYSFFYSLTGIYACDVLIPPKETFLIFNLLKLKLSGQNSISTSFFCLPLLITSVIVFLAKPAHRKLMLCLWAVAAISFYLSLGPAMKIPYASPVKAFSLFDPAPSCAKPSSTYLLKTGNDLIYKNVPGFNSMRVTARWMTLVIFMIWFSVVASIKQGSPKNRLIAASLMAVIALNIPSPLTWWKYSTKYRDMFVQLETDLISPLKQLVSPNELIAFLPWGNDAIAPYVAAEADFRTFNIAGDKNVLWVKDRWPKAFAELGSLVYDSLKATAAPKIEFLLREGGTTGIVFIHIGRMWERDMLPCDTMGARDPALKRQPRGNGFLCPQQWLVNDQPVIDELDKNPALTVRREKYFTLVRLKPVPAAAEAPRT